MNEYGNERNICERPYKLAYINSLLQTDIDTLKIFIMAFFCITKITSTYLTIIFIFIKNNDYLDKWRSRLPLQFAWTWRFVNGEVLFFRNETGMNTKRYKNVSHM